MKKLSVLVMMAYVLAGCAVPYSTGDKLQYLESQNGSALETPAPLTNANLSNFYQLPSPGQVTKVSLLPG